jgi:hypothetical protein
MVGLRHPFSSWANGCGPCDRGLLIRRGPEALGVRIGGGRRRRRVLELVRRRRIGRSYRRCVEIERSGPTELGQHIGVAFQQFQEREKLRTASRPVAFN